MTEEEIVFVLGNAFPGADGCEIPRGQEAMEPAAPRAEEELMPEVLL
jgi:hypothetical protein